MKTAGLRRLVVLALCGMPLSGYADAEGGAVGVTAGVAVKPAYVGSSHYAPQPVYDLDGRYVSAQWGTFRLGLIQGARWQLPVASPLGIALLLAYDAGRDERIRTLGGHNTQLIGMGDLDGALEAGAELSYQFAPLRAYIRGMLAVRSRDYGDEALGHTAYVEMGLDGEQALDAQWTVTGNLYATWANDGYHAGILA